MMKIISYAQYLTKGGNVSQRIFNDLDEIEDKPFKSQIEHRAILNPVAPALDETTLMALSHAAKEVNDDGFFVIGLWYDIPENNYYFYVDLDDVKTYLDHNDFHVVQANAFFPQSGSWGIVTHPDSFAYIGGSKIFIDAFFDVYPTSIDENINEFLEEFLYVKNKHGADDSFVYYVLTHLFGSKQAIVHCKNYGFSIST